MAVQMLGIKTKFTDDQGRPLVGGSVHTYYAGTSLPQDTFSDPELTVPNTNPVKLDDTGSANIFLKGTYRVRVFDRNGTFVEEQDNVDQLATASEVFKNKGGLNAANERIDALTSEVNSVKEKTLVVESIADLSTINNPKDGLRVYVKSYHAGLGEGGGYFTYDSSKADENDGGVVISGFVRTLNGFVTPEFFGAVVDPSEDNRAYIQRAADYASINSIPLELAARTYTINNYIRADSNLKIRGAGIDKSVIICDNSLGTFTSWSGILGNSTLYGQRKNIALSGFTLIAPPAPKGVRHSAIWMRRIIGFDCRKVRVVGASDAGIRVDGYDLTDGKVISDPGVFYNSRDVVVESCEVDSCYLGVELEGGVYNFSVRRNTITGSSGHGIRIPSASNGEVVGNTVEQDGLTSIWIDTSEETNEVSTNIRVHGNKVTSPFGISIAQASNISIYDNELNCGTFGISDNYAGTSLKYCDVLSVYGNTGESQINLINSKNVNVYANRASRIMLSPSLTGRIHDNTVSTPLKSTSNYEALKIYGNMDTFGNSMDSDAAGGKSFMYGQASGTVHPFNVAVPNEDYFAIFKVQILTTRAPNSSVGRSRFSEVKFSVGRNKGSETVIDLYTATSDESTSAGMWTHAVPHDIAVVIESGGGKRNTDGFIQIQPSGIKSELSPICRGFFWERRNEGCHQDVSYSEGCYDAFAILQPAY